MRESQSIVESMGWGNLPEPNHDCADKKASDDHEPCSKTPVWKGFLVFDCSRGNPLIDSLGTLTFLTQFFFSSEHDGKKGVMRIIGQKADDGVLVAAPGAGRAFIPLVRVGGAVLRKPDRTLNCMYKCVRSSYNGENFIKPSEQVQST